MPKRPRQHQVERRSRVAFEAALPDHFIFRPIAEDYGLDGEVEVFDETSNDATGVRFYVQIKATDATDTPKALSVHIRRETANYYRSVPLPTLMVRYLTKADRIFVRWFHQFDPYYGGETESGITFRWEEGDAWTPETPARLVANVAAYLRLSSRQLPLPVVFYVEPFSEAVLGLGPTDALFALQEAAARVPNVITIRRGPAPPGEGAIRFTQESTVVEFGTTAGATLHHVGGAPRRERGVFALDVMVTVALAFDQVGQEQLASRLTHIFLEQSSLLALPEVVFQLAGAMTRARRVSEALDLSDRLDESDDPDAHVASFIFLLPARLHADSLTTAERNELLRVLLARIARAELLGDFAKVGGEHYSLANLLRSAAEPLGALHHYRLARKHDPAYDQRSYFWAEVGGVLFGRRRYSDAANAYRRAIELEHDEWILALHADALMFAGRYLDAEHAFHRWNRAHSDDAGEPEWRLKESALKKMRARLALDGQIRKPEVASLRAGEVLAVNDPSEAVRILEEALKFDALSPVAWFNLGYAFRQIGDEESECFAYLMAALTNEGDAEAWVNVIVSARNLGHYELAADAVAAARRFTGERLTLQLVRFVDSQPADFPREGFLSAFEEILAELPEMEATGLTVRIPTEDGSVEEIFFPPPPRVPTLVAFDQAP